ncbi:nuclear transport factor 2 family protein [Thalassotalea euphylliae]|uniref:Nuclear transport factor 2 family protein n=1 Tax=Thalassotalea euphylliae TaxID=1655234 RepID=A0A3E0TW40_9GAMM|nr:nuclear transport factor 2 family protein [Thalassotalea euphylliae]REL28808.1 nuclear transport factor 2 family protein [Thalassotalea euphylliae]
MTTNSTHAANAPLSQDEAQVRSAIYSFSALADQSAFEYLGTLFANQVSLDYTELFGGEVHTISNQALMQQWAGFLPGFDTTFHELSNMRVVMEQGETDWHSAQVTVDFTASHWLGDSGFWAISGVYQFTLSKVDGHWAISHVKLFAKNESGSREVLAKVDTLAAKKLAAKRQLLVNID